MNLHALCWIRSDEVRPEAADAWQQPALTSESLAFLQYTSGSTTSPRGVMLTHANLLHNCEWIARRFAHTADSRGVVWLPPYHDMGLIGGVIQPIYAGFPCWLMSPVSLLNSPFSWLQAVSQHRGTTSGGPNFAYELCLRKITPEQRATLDLSCWQVAFSGAGQCAARPSSASPRCSPPAVFAGKPSIPVTDWRKQPSWPRAAEKTLRRVISPCGKRTWRRTQFLPRFRKRPAPRFSSAADKVWTISRSASSTRKSEFPVRPMRSGKSGSPGRAGSGILGSARDDRADVCRPPRRHRRRPFPAHGQPGVPPRGRTVHHRPHQGAGHPPRPKPLSARPGANRGTELFGPEPG